MFKINPNPEFTHVVKVKVPVDGGFSDQTFKVTYRVVPTSEAATFQLNTAVGATDFLRRAIIRFDELIDMNDQPVEYNHEVRDQLLGFSYLRQAVANTYFEAVSGAQAGN